MIEIFRDQDFSKVGLINGILENAGIQTMLRNRNAVSMTTEIPIPVMFPNICVFTEKDAATAHELIQAYLDQPHSPLAQDWTCPNCKEHIESTFSECWSCQTSSPNFSD